MTEIVNSISTVGFPIVMSVLLIYMMRENNKEHNKEVDKLTETLNQNTVVLQQLKELLEITIVKKDGE